NDAAGGILQLITFSGTGVSGGGVLTNTGANTQQNIVTQATMAGNATIGGATRWDFRNATTGTLTLGGFELTKIGANQISINNMNVTNGNITVNAGELAIEAGTNVVDNSDGTRIQYNDGTIMGVFANIGTVSRP